MAQYTELANITNTQNQTLSNVLLENFVSFYDWGLLNKGGYYNVTGSGAYGDKTRLYPENDPNYTSGKVWKGHRGNWVWEDINGPISISGVYVNNSLTTNYAIDHENGRIIFDSPIPASSVVNLNHSQKWVKVIPAKGVPWLRQIQQFSHRVENFSASGNWAQLGKTRIQLPTITVDVMPAQRLAPLQLGGGQWSYNDVVFNIITQNEWECKNLSDIILLQNDRAIYMYDSDKVIASGYSIKNYNNTMTEWGLASGTYPVLVDNFRYRSKCYIRESRGSDITELNQNLYIGSVRYLVETIF